MSQLGQDRRAKRGATKPLISEPEGRAAELSAARAAFDHLVALEAAYDPAAATLYGADGVVIEQIVLDGVARPAREIPLQRYKAALPHMLLLSKKAGEQAYHHDVAAEWLAPGWVRISTRRYSSQSRQPTGYEVTFRREPDGVWRIAKEVATLTK